MGQEFRYGSQSQPNIYQSQDLAKRQLDNVQQLRRSLQQSTNYGLKKHNSQAMPAAVKSTRITKTDNIKAALSANLLPIMQQKEKDTHLASAGKLSATNKSNAKRHIAFNPNSDIKAAETTIYKPHDIIVKQPPTTVVIHNPDIIVRQAPVYFHKPAAVVVPKGSKQAVILAEQKQEQTATSNTHSELLAPPKQETILSSQKSFKSISHLPSSNQKAKGGGYASLSSERKSHKYIGVQDPIYDEEEDEEDVEEAVIRATKDKSSLRNGDRELEEYPETSYEPNPLSHPHQLHPTQYRSQRGNNSQMSSSSPQNLQQKQQQCPHSKVAHPKHTSIETRAYRGYSNDRLQKAYKEAFKKAFKESNPHLRSEYLSNEDFSQGDEVYEMGIGHKARRKRQMYY